MGVFNTPIPRGRALAVIGFLSFVAVVQTWDSAPWSWGFAIICVLMTTVMRAAARARGSDWVAWPLLPAVVFPVLRMVFYGRELSWAEVFHIIGVFNLALLVGIWLGNELKIPVRRDATHE